MRLVRFGNGRLGVLRGDQVHDVTKAAGVDPGAWPPVDMLRVIREFDRLAADLDAAADSSAGTPVDAVRLDAPLVWPQKLLAYPVNYTAHGTEMQSANRADRNGFFMKASSSITGPAGQIVLPDVDRPIHHECELGVIIGRRARGIKPSDAMDVVFGFCCLIDCTVRGSEERVMRKSYDTFTPIGPALVTKDDVADPANLEMSLWVDDELRQHANTRDLILDIPGMVATAAAVLTLEPGDLIATGTPAGVGPLSPGQIVTIEIEQVGRMSLPVVQGTGGQTLMIGKS